MMNKRKLVFLSTPKSMILKKFFFSFLRTILSLTQIQAMISQNIQMKPKMRYVHPGPKLLFSGVTIKGTIRPPMPEPLATMPSATPLFFVNHCGATDSTVPYIHEAPTPNRIPCVKYRCQIYKCDSCGHVQNSITSMK